MASSFFYFSAMIGVVVGMFSGGHAAKQPVFEHEYVEGIYGSGDGTLKYVIFFCCSFEVLEFVFV